MSVFTLGGRANNQVEYNPIRYKRSSKDLNCGLLNWL